MLTALHCRAGNGGLLRTPADLVVGPGYEWDQSSDIMTINTSYGRGGVTSGNSIWRGSIDKTGGGIGETYTRVGGAKKAIVTEKLCTSGGFSGERCSLKVTATDKVIEGIRNLVEVEHTTRGNAAGQGDSGGPVFAPGSTVVSARGTVVLADGTTQVGCSGDTSGGRQCFWRIYFADIMYALSYFRATINT